MPSYSSFSDTELIALLKDGDTAAFTVIYNRYFDILYIHALQKLNDTDHAKDVVQELFTYLWVGRERVEIRSSLSAYLYTAVKNKILDFISYQKVRSNYINSFQTYIDNHQSVTDHRIREKQLAEQIENSIACLPDKMRAVFELSRKQALNHKQIAEQLNLSEETVKKQVSNALKILRSRLGSTIILGVMFLK
ncbi:RNA polymerase sigma-70 factor [Mucilaginibacter mali]|uniref:RNA polymerase sigma-70 factor n=1 Tax=Mucilaginibacter mali TaxID=2740462 RepID=A0A7D4QIQ3_9SPHI|nr:RNA polymerase sigma-70 factor [Mucilaginibacter mali]QKJ32812.1 RNA polymerase sigma-70 factor [Mucilaginibacter mali]